MAKIKIPEQVLIGLEKLVLLDSKDLNELVTALKNAEPSLLPHQLAKSIIPQVGDIPESDLIEIVGAVVATCSGLESIGETKADLINSILDEVKVEISAKSRQQVKKALNQLIDAKSIQITSKALNVLLAHEKTFHSARVLTDIRPIFIGDPEKGVSASVIVHMLELDYHQDHEIKQVFVAMDADDIRALKKTLDRSERKGKQLKSFLEKSNILNLTAE